MDALDPEQRQSCAKQARYAVEGWSQIPGTKEDGSLDEVAFREWTSEVLRLSDEHGRLWPALFCLANCLARAARRRGLEDWWPDVVLEFIDQPDPGELRCCFEVGVHNARGVTARACYDGGNQERALAAQYRALGKLKSNDYPRVTAMLESIANSYERESMREEDQA